MVIIEAFLGLAALGAILWIIFGFIFPVAIVGKMIVDDPDFFQFPDLPDVEALSEEGWELIYSAEDNDYSMLGQVFCMSNPSKYRVILSDTSHSGGVEEDIECDSYEEAKEIADEWAYAYQEED